MLEQLKRVNFDSVSLEESLSLSTFAKGLRAEYETRGIEAPEWLDTKIRELNRHIEVAVADQKAKRVREIRASLANLETPTEKRERLRRELEALDPTAVPATV